MLTDPPYNVDYTGKTVDQLTIQNDSMADDAFRHFLVDAFRNALEAMEPGAAFYIWHANVRTESVFHACAEAGMQIRQTLVWNKNQFVLGRQDYQWKHEPCLYGWKDGASHHWYGDRKQATVIECAKPAASRDHPTMKPVELFECLIRNSSQKGDTVLDLFGGSGTTLIACENAGRVCRMIEREPKYCDVIVHRWGALTGRKAERIG